MKKINAIYSLQMIESFTGALVGIFIPVYLLSINYPIGQVIVYLLAVCFFTLMFFWLAGKMLSVFGLRDLLLIRMPFLFFYLIVLFFLEQYRIPVLLLAAINAWQASLYWFPLNVLFAHHAQEKEIGFQSGYFIALPKFISIITPLLGGALTVLFGFKSIFFIAFLSSLSLLLPIMYLPNYKTVVDINWRKLKELWKKYRLFSFATIAENISGEAEGVIWPLFIYLSFKDILSVGAVGSIVGLGGVLFTIILGKFTDKYNKAVLMKIGALFMIAIWIMRYFLTGQTAYFILTLLAGFFAALVIVPFTAIVYQYAKHDIPEQFIIFQEIPTLIGRIIIYSLCFFFVGHLQIAFIVVAVSYLFFLLKKYDFHEIKT